MQNLSAQRIISVSEFKSRASDIMSEIAESGQPTVITQNGRAAAVVMSPSAYDALVEYQELVRTVQIGYLQAKSGETVDHSEVASLLSKKFGPNDE